MDLIERAAARLAQQHKDIQQQNDAQLNKDAVPAPDLTVVERSGLLPEHSNAIMPVETTTAADTPAVMISTAADNVEPYFVPELETGEIALKLDHAALGRLGMVVPDTERSAIKEEYRHIKRPLLMNSAGKGAAILKHPNLIMVSSSHPGEGKTFTAANLALSIAAERDKTVLLVDADVVRPSLHTLLGYKAEKGLVEYLRDPTIEFGSLLMKTDLPTLTILPAGNPHHLSTELLASSAMQRLTDELSTRYHDRIVIFDSPPLLPTTESCVLAQWMGQIVIVVEAERTTRSDLRETLERLGNMPETAVGFVLNKTHREKDFGYYGYGY